MCNLDVSSFRVEEEVRICNSNGWVLLQSSSISGSTMHAKDDDEPHIVFQAECRHVCYVRGD